MRRHTDIAGLLETVLGLLGDLLSYLLYVSLRPHRSELEWIDCEPARGDRVEF